MINVNFPNISITVKKVTVMITHGPDTIYFLFDGPTPFPELKEAHPEEGYDPEFKVSTRKGYALEWLAAIGISQENVTVINTTDK